jgi:hypothetical protein
MKKGWILWAFIIAGSLVWAGSVPSSTKETGVRLSAYEGKLFAGSQDPDYQDYDLALREYLIRRIHKRFGIELDPKTYSGFDLLEIESLLKFKKSNESVDSFLKMFPKTR